MAYRYAHPATAFNGIWGWLQRKEFDKGMDANQSENYCLQLMHGFLKDKALKVDYCRPTKRPKPDWMRMNQYLAANKIQKYFTQFTQYVIQKHNEHIKQ